MAGDAVLPSLRRGLCRRLPAAALLSALAIFLDMSWEITSVLARGVDLTAPYLADNGLVYAGSNTCVIKYLWLSIGHGGVFGTAFSAILAALPAAGQYVREAKMYPYLAVRSGTGSYALGKLLSASLWGGAALALGTALFISAMSLGFPLVIAGFLLELGEGAPYYTAMCSGGGLPYAAWAVYFAFLRGFLWGGAAMCLSAAVTDLFAVTACPMVFSFLLSRLCDIARVPDRLRPDFLLHMRSWLGSALPTAAAVTLGVGCVWGVCLWLFWKKLKGGQR